MHFINAMRIYSYIKSAAFDVCVRICTSCLWEMTLQFSTENSAGFFHSKSQKRRNWKGIINVTFRIHARLNFTFWLFSREIFCPSHVFRVSLKFSWTGWLAQNSSLTHSATREKTNMWFPKNQRIHPIINLPIKNALCLQNSRTEA